MEINPGFFKVLRYTSLEHLAIPKRRLMKRYKQENFPYGTVCLRDDMHVWNVKLGRNNDGDVALTKSWINIVQAYRMQPTTLIHFQSFDDETKTFNFQVFNNPFAGRSFYYIMIHNIPTCVLNKEFVEAYLGNLHASDYITVKLNEYDSYRVQLAASQNGLMFGQGWEDISRVCCFIFSSILFFTFVSDGLLELRLYDPSGTQVLIPPQLEVSQNQISHAAAASGSSVQSRSNIQAEEGLTFQIKYENSRLRLPKSITDSASMENQPVLDTWKLKYIDGSLHFVDIKKGNDKSRERYSLIYRDYIREFNGINVGDQVSFTFFPSKRLLVIDQGGYETSIPAEFSLLNSKYAWKIDVSEYNTDHGSITYGIIKYSNDLVITTELDDRFADDKAADTPSANQHSINEVDQQTPSLNMTEKTSVMDENSTPKVTVDKAFGKRINVGDTNDLNLEDRFSIKRNLKEIYDVDEYENGSSSKAKSSDGLPEDQSGKFKLLTPKLEKLD
ncbi:hypothetical protein QVD17_16699 [Tagetes erecta]|uniref:TF-B3 domain-containing protein n=1 Tax=Tagetes erecta TaxID=13708 RepID=A0AAD8NZS5_TARER|nr:hypothetical protein QVD17_16699 [Tagetes erecta]